MSVPNSRMEFMNARETPLEILFEIAGYHADDIQTLLAMSLASRAMRRAAIEHLFSCIHFACMEDFTWWLEMLHRTPSLGGIVTKVKFSEPEESWLRHHRLGCSTKGLRASVPPVIPPLLNVRAVKWGPLRFDFSLDVITTYVALFPNVKRLSFESMNLGGLVPFTKVLGACGRLESLSLQCVWFGPYEDEDDDDEEDSGEDDEDESHRVDKFESVYHRTRKQLQPRTYPFDLSHLVELSIVSSDYKDPQAGLIRHILETSPPSSLKSLLFRKCDEGHWRETCDVPTMEKLLRLSASSLTNLIVDPNFTDGQRIVEMFTRLPAFPNLDMLTLELGDNRQAEKIVNALRAAPKLTALIFQITLDDPDDYSSTFMDIITTVFPWRSQIESGPLDDENPYASLRNYLTEKFPSLKRIGFRFCAPRDSTLHFRRRLRRWMELRLKARLKRSGADVADFLEIRWLDDKLDPVVYNNKNGKPLQWKFPVESHRWSRYEPATEGSDCELKEHSDSDDDLEYTRKWTWTAADERAYRREMLEDCYDYRYGW